MAPGFPEQAWQVLVALRPKHWIKNLFLFSPLLFSGHFRAAQDIFVTAWGFAIFCLAASSVYLFNDILDLERDRATQGNRDRPIAAGKIRVGTAAFMAIALQLLAWVLAFFLELKFLGLVILYALNNVLYSLLLKHRVIIDVISIAIGFILRILAGAALIHVEVSHWLIVCTFNVSLLLGFGKRRAELQEARQLRPVNEIYTEAKLDHMMSVSAAVTLFSYMLYSVAPETTARFGSSDLIYTVPFVVYGIFRYVAKIQEGKYRDPVQMIYADKVFLLNIFLWMGSVMVVLVRAYPPAF
ncbi:MAG: decaprenyl-phosphate phosphoribosyltransferase [Candidatus Binatia bacterium]